MEILNVVYLDRLILDTTPLTLRSRYEVPNGTKLKTRATRLVLEALSYARLERYLKEGFDTEPATLDELVVLLNDLVRTAETENAISIIGLASPTGWSEEAEAYVSADVSGKSFSHRLVMPCLIDLQSGRLVYSLDDRLLPFVSLFSPRLFAEEVQEAVAYVRETLDAKVGSLTLNQVVERLAVEPAVVQEAFRKLKSSGQYLVDDITGLGLVISQKSSSLYST